MANQRRRTARRQHLHRHMALVVDHGHADVVALAGQHQVGAVGAMRVDALGLRGAHGGHHQAVILVAEQPALPGMRVQSAHTNARAGVAEHEAGLVAGTDGVQHRLGPQVRNGAGERLVQRDMRDAQPGAGQHQEGLVQCNAKLTREVAGIAGEFHAARIHRGLVVRAADDGIRRAGLHQRHGGIQEGQRRHPRLSTDAAERRHRRQRHGVEADLAARQPDAGIGELQRQPQPGGMRAQHFGIAHQRDRGARPQRRVRRRPQRNLRPDAGWVAQRDGQPHSGSASSVSTRLLS